MNTNIQIKMKTSNLACTYLFSIRVYIRKAYIQIRSKSKTRQRQTINNKNQERKLKMSNFNPEKYRKVMDKIESVVLISSVRQSVCINISRDGQDCECGKSSSIIYETVSVYRYINSRGQA
jgi:hypothetical protein